MNILQNESLNLTLKEHPAKDKMSRILRNLENKLLAVTAVGHLSKGAANKSGKMVLAEMSNISNSWV